MTVNALTGNKNTQLLHRISMEGSFISHG